MSDGTEQSSDDAVRTGEVRVPETAGAVLPPDSIAPGGDDASLGAAGWPAGEADAPQGQAEVRESQDEGTVSGSSESAGSEHETDDGELTPSDPSQPIEPLPPANLAEPLR